MSYPYLYTLTGLTDREAIADAVYRVIIGFDTNDFSILESAFAGEDVIIDLNAKTIPGLSAIKAGLFPQVGPLDTMHNISNIHVDVKAGANTAALSAVALALQVGRGRIQVARSFCLGVSIGLTL